ncbi:MAG: hypothetical protein H7Z75_10680 [Ferruginibacter sp.]|nr:hypothetical protein [Cytophagales bacterium]
MQALFHTVRERRAKLEKTAFIQLLSDTSADVGARLAYVPDMLFFIMGFKDILHGLQQEDTTDEMQQHVNEHCKEDNGHWKWFLRDLDVIQVRNNYLRQPNFKLFSELWSDENYPIRDVVYQTIHYSKLAPTSAHRMVILEVIEAVFSVYVEHMTVLVNQLDKYEEWTFFGRVHYDAESGHSNGSWLDGGKQAIEAEAHMNPAEKQLALSIIDGMFDKFEAMFEQWYRKQEQHLTVSEEVA